MEIYERMHTPVYCDDGDDDEEEDAEEDCDDGAAEPMCW